MKQLLSVIIIGYGDRGQIYSSYALKHPDDLRVVGVVEPNDQKRIKAQKLFNISDEMCFTSVDELVIQSKKADVIFNTTMDHLHYQTTLPLLKAGYDVLLEKPITSDIYELIELNDVAKKYHRKLVICHVLRYAPFYVKVKELISEIGEISSIEANEHIGISHVLSAYIRGKWNNDTSSLLMAKSCHDLDLLCWLNSDTTPKSVVSLASRSTFTPKKAPVGAGERCMVDCEVESTCPYSCKRHFIDHNVFRYLVWDNVNGKDCNDLTIEEKLTSLQTDNPHGECAFKVKSKLVDKQAVIIKFNNGRLATFNLVSGAPKSGRSIHVIGTLGEIEGNLNDNILLLHKYNLETLKYETTEIAIINVDKEQHGGGDYRLVADFINYIRNDQKSISTTDISDSIFGHLCVIASEVSRNKNAAVTIESLFNDDDSNFIKNKKQCKIIAHRGFSGLVPENTLLAFELAGKTNCFGLESDVRTTKDGKFIMFHDDTLKRMTNMEGNINDLTYDEIKDIEIISGNNVENFPNLKIPTLDDYLEVCVRTKLVPILEIKTVHEYSQLDEIIAKVTEYGLYETINIISFKKDYLIYLRNKYPTLKIQLLVPDICEENIEICKQYHFDIDSHFKSVNKKIIDLCHDYGIMVNIYTVDNIKIANKLINDGLDYLTTNKLL